MISLRVCASWSEPLSIAYPSCRGSIYFKALTDFHEFHATTGVYYMFHDLEVERRGARVVCNYCTDRAPLMCVIIMVNIELFSLQDC